MKQIGLRTLLLTLVTTLFSFSVQAQQYYNYGPIIANGVGLILLLGAVGTIFYFVWKNWPQSSETGGGNGGEQTRTDVSAIQNQVNQLNQALGSFIESRERNDQEIKALIDNLKGTIVNPTEELNQQKQSLQTIQARLGEVNEYLGRVQQSFESLTTGPESVTGRVGQANTNVEALRAEIAGLRAELATAGTNAGGARDASNTLTGRVQELSTQLAALLASQGGAVPGGADFDLGRAVDPIIPDAAIQV